MLAVAQLIEVLSSTSSTNLSLCRVLVYRVPLERSASDLLDTQKHGSVALQYP